MNASKGKSKTIEKLKLEKSSSSLNGSAIKKSSDNAAENNKLPHPPQSSKPQGSATRKIRLSAKTAQAVQVQPVKKSGKENKLFQLLDKSLNGFIKN